MISPDLARLFALISGILFFVLCMFLLEDHRYRLRQPQEAGPGREDRLFCECACR